MKARAELIEDRGEAAAGEEFFRSRPFLEAEGVTHTLRIQASDAELVAPLIVREIPGAFGALDAISPYGYPGLVAPGCGRGFSPHRTETSATAGEGTPLDPGAVAWAETGLVSIFLRHTLGKPLLAGTTERSVVQVADPALPRKSRPSDRRQVRRNLEAGYELRLLPGVETTAEQRAGFLDVYEQTMRRAGAASHYFFAAAYFDRVLEADRTWLVLAHAPDASIAAASIAAVSDGFLHYYLSGSADARLREAPMKNIVTRLVDHAGEIGLPLNLGGGLSPGDPLEEFKRGFANRQQPWRTSELICDPSRYRQLSEHRSGGGFFPAYRAPS